MADVRMQSSAMPAAPPRYDQRNEADFRRLVGMLTSRVDNVLQRLREDIEDAVNAGDFAHASTHETGGADALTSLSAAILDSGELVDARLSSNVPLLDAQNDFSVPQTIDGNNVNTNVLTLLNTGSGATNAVIAGDVQRIRWTNSDLDNRWIIQVLSDDDDGDNDGGEMQFLRRNDAGGPLGTVLELGRDAGGRIGFYGTTAIAQQTGVAVTASAIHAALVNLGLITA